MNSSRRAALLLALAAPISLAQRQPTPIERLRALPPAERRRLLDRLPPDRRKQAEDSMNRLDRMSPEEQHELDRRYEFFQKLPPGRQQDARRLYRDLTALPPERHSAVRRQIDLLRSMSSAERASFLSAPQSRSLYNRKERAILADYVSLLEAPSR